LEEWKRDIPEMPSINFDEDAEKSFEEIKNISVSDFRKLFKNQSVCKEILPILFPEDRVLHLLYKYFSGLKSRKTIYATLATRIKGLL
jgi:hypothetical protein